MTPAWARTPKADRRSGQCGVRQRGQHLGDPIKQALGKLALPEDIFAIIEAEDFLALPMDAFTANRPGSCHPIIRILSIAC